jgi:TPP-dependent pyruvate/acetoin dehydrogenase alpha subunit
MHISHARVASTLDVDDKEGGRFMPSEAVDGMDVPAVDAAARHAAAGVRRGSRPDLLELRTYRVRPTFEGDQSSAMLAALEASVGEELAEAVEFAEAGH